MKKIVFTLLLLIIVAGVFAQPASIDWEQHFGGLSDDYGNYIQPTSDGGYIIGGSVTSNDGDVSGNHGGTDYWVVKLSATGGLEWQKTFGGSLSDLCYAVFETPDGGYIAGGRSASTDGNISNSNGDNDVWLVKLSSTGSIQWEKSYGGSGSDYFGSMNLTSDGGYILAVNCRSNDGNVTGHHGPANTSDYWVVKLLQNGNIEWQKSLGGIDQDYPNLIQQTADGGYIVGGTSNSTDGDVSGNHGDYDAWVVKLSSTGNIQWQKSMGGAEYEAANDIVQTADGGYVFVGSCRSNDGDVTGHHGNAGTSDVWVVRMSSTGVIDWQRSLGGSNGDYGNEVCLTNGGDYIIAGTVYSNDGDITGHHGLLNASDYWLAKVSSSGSLDWQQSYGGTGDDACESLALTIDGGIIMGGHTNSNDGDVGGNHNSNYDVWVVKTEGTLSVNSLSNETAIVISPNPAADNITIKGADIAEVEVYDAVGKLVLSAEHTNTLSLVSLSKGIYVVKLLAENGAAYYSGKIIKE